MSADVVVRTATARSDLDAAAELLREYARGLGLDLAFQGFEREVRDLPGRYASPGGAILLALLDGRPVGCVAFRPFGAGACEMKRLYVRPGARRGGIGRKLALRAIYLAREAGYRRMLLDTMSDMAEANGLYESLGFRSREPYYDNPLPGAVYYEVEL